MNELFDTVFFKVDYVLFTSLITVREYLVKVLREKGGGIQMTDHPSPQRQKQIKAIWRGEKRGEKVEL